MAIAAGETLVTPGARGGRATGALADRTPASTTDRSPPPTPQVGLGGNTSISVVASVAIISIVYK